MDSNRCSENMRRIKSKDTSIELLLRKRLWQEGIRYRKNYSCLPGKPDIAITKYKIAIFCDGEFFHGKDWNTLKQRLSKGQNSKYWVDKIERNITRDRINDKMLLYYDWVVLHFWENDIKNDLENCIETIKEVVYMRIIEKSSANSIFSCEFNDIL